MKQICEAFDELQKKKSSDLKDDADKLELGFEAQSVDGVEDNEVEVDLKDGTGIMVSDGETVNEEVGDSCSKFERCSHRQGERDCEDVQPSAGGGPSDSLSPVKSYERKGKILDGAEPKKEIDLKSCPDSSPHLVEGAVSGDGHRALSNGHKLKKMGSGSKRSEVGVEIHKSKNASGRKELFAEDKTDSEICGGKKAKGLPKAKSHLKVPNETHRPGVDPKEQFEDKLTGRTKKAQLGLGDSSLGTNELHPAKKLKHVDARDDSSVGSLSKNKKGLSPSPMVADGKAAAKSDLKKSTSQVKTENQLTSRPQNVVVPNVSGDETALPLTKRRRRALEAMSESDIKMEKDSAVKNDVSSSSNIRAVASQVQKKRRAVCLYDDDDDKAKTPVHGGSATKLKAPLNVSDDNRSSDANNEKCEKSLDHGKDYTKLLDSHTKESSTLNGSLSPDKFQADDKELASDQSDEKGSEGHPHSDEKRPDKEEKSESEQLSSKEAKPILMSPKKSPHMLSAIKPVVEQIKVTKPMAKVSNVGSLKKAQAVSSKGSVSVPNSSQNQVTIQRNKPASSTERSKTTPKSQSRINEAVAVREKSTEPGERYEFFLLVPFLHLCFYYYFFIFSLFFSFPCLPHLIFAHFVFGCQKELMLVEKTEVVC